MSDQMFFDVGGVYEKAAETAERALMGGKELGFGLEDIADEDTLTTAFSNPLMGQMLVEGTLTGCLAALTHTPHAIAGPLKANAAGPQGTSVNTDDMRHAHAILDASIAGKLDDSERGATIAAELPSNYTGNVQRMSSIVLALVVLTNEIIHHAD